MARTLPRGSLSPFGRVPTSQNALYRIPLHYTEGLKSKGFGKGTCGRSSTGWFFNPEDGYLDSAATTVARIEAKGLLVEPASTNLCLRSRELSTSPWVNSTTLTMGKSEVGIDGEENSAWLLTDPDTDVCHNMYQVITIDDDSLTNVVSIYVKKSKAPVNHVFGMQLSLINGDAINAIGQINLYTGAVGCEPSYPPDYYSSESVGDWWRFSVGVTNDSSGNTGAVIYLYPCHTTALNLAGSVAPVGSTIVDNVQLEAGKISATSPIITEAAAVTRNTDDSYSWPIPTVVSTLLATTGTMLCLWTPGYNYSDFVSGSSHTGIVSAINNSSSFLWAAYTTGLLYSFDGSATATGPSLSYLAGNTYIVAVRWGYIDSGAKFQVGILINGTWSWGTGASFDGAFSDTGTLYIGQTIENPFHIKNIYFYPLLTQAQIEEMF